MQITLRLNGKGEAEVQRIKDVYGYTKNAPAVEYALLMFRTNEDNLRKMEERVKELEREKLELQAVVAYLESTGR